MPFPEVRPSLPAGGQTLVYSTVDGHEIKLDYYLPRNAAGNLPGLIYYHGGGMTAGSRRDAGFPMWLSDHCQEKGYILVSADYRLCQPSTALDQIDDSKALFKFLAGEEFKQALPEAVSLDTSRLAVTGFSAGAYSARAACVYADPKPAVLLTGYGTGGDWLLDHWTSGRPPTSIAKFVDLSKAPELLASTTVVSDDSPEEGLMSNRFALTVRWEIDGTLLDGCLKRPGLCSELNKVDYSQRASAVPEDVKPGFLQLFVTKDYPPSVFIHGTADEVVLSQESIHHYDQLKELGVKTELLLVEDGPHGLCDFSSGFPPKPWPGSVDAYGRGLKFIAEAFQEVE